MSNLTYLDQARKLLTDDYNNRHTAEYNSWQFNVQNAWRGDNIPLPFPPFIYNPGLAPFQPTVSCPTEDEIVAKALELYRQQVPAETVTEPLPNQSVDATVEEPVAVEPTSESGQHYLYGVLVTDGVSDIEPFAEELSAIEIPVPEPVLESVLEEAAVSAEELTLVEEPAPPTVVAEPEPYIVAIQDIYKDLGTVPTTVPVDIVVPEIKLETYAMPAAQLADAAKENEKLLPSVLRKIEELKMSWAGKK